MAHPDSDSLRQHQRQSLAIIDRAVAAIADGPKTMLDASPGLRVEMTAALGAYQRFKHEHIFDPAIASGDRQRAVLARHMKIACISAGEVFRIHMMKWTPDRITADWPAYQVAARLTANQLRRHIVTEAEGIADLLCAYA